MRITLQHTFLSCRGDLSLEKKIHSFPIYISSCFVGEVCEPVPCENGADCPSTPSDENVSCEFLRHFLMCSFGFKKPKGPWDFISWNFFSVRPHFKIYGVICASELSFMKCLPIPHHLKTYHTWVYKFKVFYFSTLPQIKLLQRFLDSAKNHFLIKNHFWLCWSCYMVLQIRILFKM